MILNDKATVSSLPPVPSLSRWSSVMLLLLVPEGTFLEAFRRAERDQTFSLAEPVMVVVVVVLVVVTEGGKKEYFRSREERNWWREVVIRAVCTVDG